MHDTAQKVIELYALGYNDLEIRKALEIDVLGYVQCWKFIKTENLIFTDTVGYFEKALIRIDANIKQTHDVLKDKKIEALNKETGELEETVHELPAATKLSFIKHLLDLEMKRLEVMQKFGELDPDSQILEIRTKHQEELTAMTDEQLTAYHHYQANKVMQ